MNALQVKVRYEADYREVVSDGELQPHLLKRGVSDIRLAEDNVNLQPTTERSKKIDIEERDFFWGQLFRAPSSGEIVRLEGMSNADHRFR